MRQMYPFVYEGVIDVGLLGQDPLSIVGGGRGAIYQWRERWETGGKGER